MPIPNSGEPKIARRLLRDEARDAIRAAILDGTLSPGEQLDDVSLQDWLGISRTPIREAIVALQVEGLVEIAPQAHTRVVVPSQESVEYTLQTAGVLFGGIVRTVVPALDEQTRAELSATVARAEEQVDARDVRAHMTAGLDVYDFLLRHCPNPVLRKLATDTVTSLTFRYRMSADRRTPNWDLLADGWSRMREAVLSGDPVGAELALEDMHRLPVAGDGWAPATWS